MMHASQVPGVVWSSDHCAVGTEVGALEMALPGLSIFGAFLFPSPTSALVHETISETNLLL